MERQNFLLFLQLVVFSFSSFELTEALRTVSLGDTLYAEKSITVGVTMVSLSGKFEMGFFTPGNTSNYYIGIWYKEITPQTVIWLANRETPVSFSEIDSAQLKIIEGNLVLLNGNGHSIWSTNIRNSSTTKPIVVAALGDDSNLILKDESNNSLWTSFDHPSDCTMPGLKFGYNKRTKTQQLLTSWTNSEDPTPGLFSLGMNSKGEVVVKWNNSVQYWSTGPWNGHGWGPVPLRLNPNYNFTYVNNSDEIYFQYFIFNPSVAARLILDVTGEIKILFWLNNTRQWNVLNTKPTQPCDVYAYCGAYGVCNESSSPLCNCLPGFTPMSKKDWDLNNFSGGCERKTILNCGNATASTLEENKFWMHSHMRLPVENDIQTSVSRKAECESTCLNNCFCTAYAFDGNKCLTWDGDLFNLQQLSQDDSNVTTIYVKLAASEFSSVPKAITNQKNASRTLKVALPTTIATTLLLCSIMYLFYRTRRASRTGNPRLPWLNTENDLINEDDEKGIDVPFFSFESLLVATNNFSEENMLGRGGFGPVYKGKFEGGREIAIKRLSAKSGQGIDEFKNEVVLIARLQHRNLVRLIGYCIQGNEKILLYEYMANKSLDTFIFDKKYGALLNWKKRIDIIMGIARGLLYLHHDSRLRIIHRDLKTSNILLDKEMNPKISDFGLARIVKGNSTEANTNKIVGTYGYMSPEYALDGLFSIKSDVFSFGVVILEIICGKRNTGFYQQEEALNLLSYVWRLWNEGNVMTLVDELVLESCNEEDALKCINIALLCVQGDASIRPSMPNVIIMLGSERSSLPKPSKPAFTVRIRTCTTATTSSSSKSYINSNNELTVTLEDGR